MTDNLDMLDAGMTGPVTASSSVIRQTSRGTQLVIVCWMRGPSGSVWDAVVDANATSLNDGTPRLAVSDTWLDTGGDTSKLMGQC